MPMKFKTKIIAGYMRVIILVFAASAILPNSYATGFAKSRTLLQNTKPSDTGPSYGFKIGGAISNFSQNIQRAKNGIAVGGFVEYQMMPYLGIELDVLYQQEGANQVDPGMIYHASSISIDNVTKVNSNVTLNTLHVPLLLSINAPDLGNVCPKILLGGSFDYYLSAITKDLYHDDVNNLILADRQKEDVTSSFASTNYCAIGGIGIDFYGNNLKYGIEVRYKMGLKTINNLATYNIGNFYKEDFSSNSFQVLFTVSF
jgi:hypothetical protein